MDTYVVKYFLINFFTHKNCFNPTIKLNKLASTVLLCAPVEVLCIESARQPNITSIEPSNLLIEELG